MYRLYHARSANQVYNRRARGQGDYKPQVGMTNIFHDFKVMFIQLNEATNHTVQLIHLLCMLYDINRKCIVYATCMVTVIMKISLKLPKLTELSVEIITMH